MILLAEVVGSDLDGARVGMVRGAFVPGGGSATCRHFLPRPLHLRPCRPQRRHLCPHLPQQHLPHRWLRQVQRPRYRRPRRTRTSRTP